MSRVTNRARELKVLHLTYGLDFGGVESHLRLIAESRAKRHDHVFAAIAVGGAAAQAIAAAGSQVRVLDQEPWDRPAATFRAVLGLVRSGSFDVVHCHGSEGNIFGLSAAFLCLTKVRIG